MKITNFICANILSLLGNIGLFVVLSYTYLAILVYPDYLVDGIIFKLLSICLNTYIYNSHSSCFIANRRYIST